MAVAALLHPEILDPELPTEPIRPEQVAAPLECGDHVVVVHLWAHHLLLAPDGAPIGPVGPHVAPIEQLLPEHGRLRAQGVHIVAHLEQSPAPRALIDDLRERVSVLAAPRALEPGVVWHIGLPAGVGHLSGRVRRRRQYTRFDLSGKHRTPAAGRDQDQQAIGRGARSSPWSLWGPIRPSRWADAPETIPPPLSRSSPSSPREG